jgi:dTMP kinase
VSGYFIAFEGPEGSGKSTQARALATALEADGRRVCLTREPGGTAIGEQIRAILLDHANSAMLPETEALLYTAARAQHVGDVIRPALAANEVVVCDRFLDSTLVYQGVGRGLAVDALAAVQRFAIGGLEPDLRVLLDLPVERGLQRRRAGLEEFNRLDAADLAFHERVRRGYLDRARANPTGWVVVDADDDPDVVAARVVDAVRERLGERPEPALASGARWSDRSP